MTIKQIKSKLISFTIIAISCTLLLLAIIITVKPLQAYLRIQDDCNYIIPSNTSLMINDEGKYIIKRGNESLYLYNMHGLDFTYLDPYLFNDSCQAKGALKQYILNNVEGFKEVVKEVDVVDTSEKVIIQKPVEKIRGKIEQQFHTSTFVTYVWWDNNIAYTIYRERNYLPTKKEKREDSLKAVRKLNEIKALMGNR